MSFKVHKNMCEIKDEWTKMASCTAFFTFLSCSWHTRVWVWPLALVGPRRWSVRACDQDIVTRVQSLRQWEMLATRSRRKCWPYSTYTAARKNKTSIIGQKLNSGELEVECLGGGEEKNKHHPLLLDLTSGYRGEPGIFVTCRCQFTSVRVTAILKMVSTLNTVIYPVVTFQCQQTDIMSLPLSWNHCIIS